MLADEVIWLLRDGAWHGLREVVKGCSLPKPQVERAVNFLREFNFIQVDRRRGETRLSPLIFKFIDEMQHVERDAALSRKVL